MFTFIQEDLGMSGIQWDQADKSDSSKTQKQTNSVLHSAERRTSLTHKRRTSLGSRIKSPSTRNSGPRSPDADKKEEASRSIISPPASMRKSMLEKSQFKSPPLLAQGQAQNQKSPQEPRQTPHRPKSSLAKTESTSGRKRRQSRSPAPKSRSPTPVQQKQRSSGSRSRTTKSNSSTPKISRTIKENPTVSSVVTDTENRPIECDKNVKDICSDAPKKKSPQSRKLRTDNSADGNCDKKKSRTKTGNHDFKTPADRDTDKYKAKPENPLISPNLYSEPICDEIVERENGTLPQVKVASPSKDVTSHSRNCPKDSMEESFENLNLNIQLSDSSQDGTDNKEPSVHEHNTGPPTKHMSSEGVPAGSSSEKDALRTSQSANLSNSQIFSKELDLSLDGAVDQYMQEFCTQNAMVAKTASPLLPKVSFDKKSHAENIHVLGNHDTKSNSLSDSTADDLNQAVAVTDVSMDTQNIPIKEVVSIKAKEAKQLFTSFTGD